MFALIAGLALCGAPQDLPAQLDAAVREATAGRFWGAVLVTRGGTTLLSKGYGAADYAKRPIGSDTLFELASASKQVTATAILRLEQERRLKTADPLSRFFRDVPADKRGITVKHLLNHTAGVDNEAGVGYASPISRDAFVAHLMSARVVAPPGTRFAYWNGGYALLAAIVEVASGQPFETYCAQHLFRPAGLRDTGFINDRRLDRRRVTVRRNAAGEPFTAADWHWGWGYRGMGGVVTTLDDLGRWDRALRGDRVLRAPALAKLLTPALEGYACGWMVEVTERGTTKAQHSGRVEGYVTQVSRWIDEDVFVAILSNGETDVGAVERALQRLLFEPPTLHAVVRWDGLTLDRNQGAELQGPVAWQAQAAGDVVVLELRQGDRVPVTITMAPGVARHLIARLERAAAGKGARAPGGLTPEIHLANYRLETSPLELASGLRFEVRPRYEGANPDGSPAVDDRVTCILEDRSGGGKYPRWPVLAKMGPAETRALVAQLRAALP